MSIQKTAAEFAELLAAIEIVAKTKNVQKEADEAELRLANVRGALEDLRNEHTTTREQFQAQLAVERAAVNEEIAKERADATQAIAREKEHAAAEGHTIRTQYERLQEEIAALRKQAASLREAVEKARGELASVNDEVTVTRKSYQDTKKALDALKRSITV